MPVAGGRLIHGLYVLIGEWDVSHVTDLSTIFSLIIVESNLSGLSTRTCVSAGHKVTNTEMRFCRATSFKQALCCENWINSKTNKADTFGRVYIICMFLNNEIRSKYYIVFWMNGVLSWCWTLIYIIFHHYLVGLVITNYDYWLTRIIIIII